MQIADGVYFTGSYSTLLWMFLVGMTGNTQAVYMIKNTGMTDFFSLVVNNSGILNVNLGVSTTKLNAFSNGAVNSAYLSRWVHVGVVLDSTRLSFYLNGTLTNNMTLTYTTINNVDRTSNFFGDTSYPLNAYLDDVYFFMRALSASEVLQIMNYYN